MSCPIANFQVEFEHAEEQDSTEEDEQQQEEAVDPDTQNASSASQQVAAYPSSYHSTDVKTDYGAAGTVVEDSVDSLLKGSREAVAADKAATAALVAKPKVRGWHGITIWHLTVQKKQVCSAKARERKGINPEQTLTYRAENWARCNIGLEKEVEKSVSGKIRTAGYA